MYVYMNSLADKCKNAIVTHCMVLKDKKHLTGSEMLRGIF